MVVVGRALLNLTGATPWGNALLWLCCMGGTHSAVDMQTAAFVSTCLLFVANNL